MKKVGRILSAVMASAALLMQVFPGFVFADKEKPVIEFTYAEAQAGESLSVDMRITGNTGFCVFKFNPVYDEEVLELRDVEMLAREGTYVYENSVVYRHSDDYNADGDFMRFKFKILQDAPVGDTSVSVLCSEATSWTSEDDVYFDVVPGTVTVKEFKEWKDIDESGKLDLFRDGELPVIDDDEEWNEIKSNVTSVAMSDTVTSVSEGFFNGFTSLKSIKLPESVKKVGDGAFKGCTSLTEVKLPDTVDKIGRNVFEGCESLGSIDIPARVTVVDDGAFKDCTSLESISLPENVEYIGRDTFAGCSGLENINISGDTLKTIGSNAFSDTSIKVLDIPESVEDIGYGAFMGCRELTSIVLPDGVTYTSPSAFAGCTALKTVTLPSTLERLGMESFEGCIALETITIPEKVNSLGGSLFKGCSALKSVYILGRMPAMSDKEVFADTPGELTVYYVPGQPGWNSPSSDWKSMNLVSHSHKYTCTEEGHSADCFCGYKLSHTAHTGGKATCSDKAVCEVCGYSYGEIAKEGHNIIPAGDKFICAECGTYFLDAEGKLPVSELSGDINGDGKVNSKDLTRLMKHIAGEKVELAGSADINGDGKVNSKDLTRLMKNIAGQ